jgi:hypothetical protein
MESIREQINKNPLLIGVIAGFVVGTLIGWMILGWLVFPVVWVDAQPKHLIYAEKVEYLHTAMQAFGYNGDAAKAQARYNALGDEKDKALNEIVQKPGDLPIDLVLAFSNVVLGPGKAITPGAPGGAVTPGAPGLTPGAPGAATTPGAPVATESPPKKSLLGTLWPFLCGIVLILAAVLAFLAYRLLRKPAGTGEVTPAMEADQARRQATWTDYESEGAEPPTAQFMASYKLGDDLFDDSFSIDSATGEFLGECGVGISDTVGVGEPKKVTAFEVWLFDKNDIQTVTKVVMSSNAFNDIPTRQRLEAKGEPVLAQPGAETILETQTLQLQARVVDMSYGHGASPEDSFFDTFILELAIWQK